MSVLILALFVNAAGADTLRIPVAPAETLQVTVTGAGPAVVLIPGIFGSAFGFRKLAADLDATGFRTVVIEPLGVASSSRPGKANYSLTAQADRIAAVLDSLGIHSAIVVAHSLGASMAFRLAYRRPDLLRGLVSLDGGPVESARTPGLRSVTQYTPLIKLLGVGIVRRKLRASLIRASGDPSWVTDSVLAEYTAGPARDLGGTLRALSRMADSREPELLEPHLAEIRCPVRLVLGLAPHPEAMTDPEIERLRTHLGRLSIDSVPGAGHHVHEERPGMVADAIRRLHTLALTELTSVVFRAPPPP